ncbi:MAG: hypothetical protein V4719_10455 [Planctomycetota bacterium]
MKKLVTLSAVALAGATLGVGTTFGWWAADADVETKVPKATLADPVVPTNSPPGESNDLLLIQTVPTGEIKSEAKPGKVNSPFLLLHQPPPLAPVVTYLADPNVSQLGIDVRGPIHQNFQFTAAAFPKVEQLAKELEQEAQQLEEKGQKDAAAAKRNLAHRVRETLRGFQVMASDKNGVISSRNIVIGVAGTTTGAIAATPSATLEVVQNQVPQPRESLEHAQDAATKNQLEVIRELQKELAKRANAQVKSESYTITGGDPSVVGPNERQQRIIVRGVNGVSPLVIQELQKVAKNLEREGHKDQARAIREHSERLQSQAREIETTVQFKAHVQAERERDAAPADRDQNSYGSDSRPRDPNKRDRPREVLRDAEPGPRLSDDSLRRSPRDGEHRDPGDLDAPRRAAPPSAEVYHLLRELHHEITLLRADVRDLKSKLDREQHSNYRERHPEAAGSDGNTRREKSDRRSEGESKQDGQDEDPVLKD